MIKQNANAAADVTLEPWWSFTDSTAVANTTGTYMIAAIGHFAFERSEASIFGGTGSQLSNLARWGVYSSLSVDPSDDCTMYFTTEYLATSGTFNWHIRIGKVNVAVSLPLRT